VESVTGQPLHEESEVKNEEICSGCGDYFYGTAIVVDNYRRVCNHCFRGTRQTIIFDEAKVNPYGKNQNRLR